MENRGENIDNLFDRILNGETKFVVNNLSSIMINLTRLRVEKHLSTADLARLCGVSKRRMMKIERLEIIPRLDIVLTMCYHLQGGIKV